MKIQNIIHLFNVGVISLALLGCAGVPKPEELVALEEIRDSKQYPVTKKGEKDLVSESDKAHAKSVEAWEDEELEESKHWATIATIKFRTAEARVQKLKNGQHIANLKAQQAKVQKKMTGVSAKIAEADEKLALYARLSDARKSAESKEQQLQTKLSEAEQRTNAQQKLSAAQLAVKRAETVDAKNLATSEYTQAVQHLASAEGAFKMEKNDETITMAALAQTKADVAYNIAKPKYMNAKETATRQARNQALQKDAGGIPGVTAKLQTSGQTQQLILPLTAAFKKRKAIVQSEKVMTLNQVAELLKKYSEYPVMINGYTSYLVRAKERYSLSQSRAQQVANHFVSMGIPLKRFAVSGRGAEELIAAKRSQQNDRVEIIILFQ